MDKDGKMADRSYNYASLVGMLQYLQAHSHPELTFAVSQCDRFTNKPKRSHEVAYECIGQYLKNTLTDGLVIKPTGKLDIDCYVDADFAGLWQSEDKQEPSYVKSCTGFVICHFKLSSDLEEQVANRNRNF